jgi:methyl halide transferase
VKVDLLARSPELLDILDEWVTRTYEPAVGLIMEQSPDNIEFWESLYQSRNTPWDLGKPAPPLQTYLSSPYAIPPGRMAVLGCGRGHECLLFAQHGFEVTGIDFAPSAVQETAAKFTQAGCLGKTGFLLEKDVFNLHEYFGYYDYVVEHCLFCAIEPSRRRTYAWTVRDLLKPGGQFVALWWLVAERQGGPPFHVHKSEIFNLFRDSFLIDIAYEPKDSVNERQGQEFLTVMMRL